MKAEWVAAATFAVGLLAGTPHAASAPYESGGAIRLADSQQQSTDSQQHPSSEQHPSITLRVCNRTSGKVEVASSFIAVGESDWTNKGWTGVESGACEDIFVTTNQTFYARAEVAGDSDSYWGTDIKQCVEYPGPYNFKTSSDDTSCPEGEAAMFTTFKSNGQPVYVWNLNP